MITNSAFVDKLNSGIAVGGYYMSSLPLKSMLHKTIFNENSPQNERLNQSNLAQLITCIENHPV